MPGISFRWFCQKRLKKKETEYACGPQAGYDCCCIDAHEHLSPVVIDRLMCVKLFNLENSISKTSSNEQLAEREQRLRELGA